jgi:DNA (cytosine-5)-methyltransferase 1
MVNLFCVHWEPFSETWPTSGSMRNGQAFERRMPERPTTDSESSLLRTPAASEAERGHQPEEKAKARGGQVTLSGQFMSLLPTPASTDVGRVRDLDNRIAKGSQIELGDSVRMLPTPKTMDYLPARDESKIDRSKGGFSNVRETVMRPGFGRFEPAIRRWERVTGFLAPAPTEPDGREGAPRLSPKFTEWMMGLNPGWVTGHGLSRTDELKLCGNGVVPQQAVFALSVLLERKNSL